MTQTKTVPVWASIPISVVSWVLVAFFTVVCFLLGLITLAPLSLLFTLKTRYLIHQVAVWWSKSILYTSPVWRVKLSGKENVEPGKRYVIVANHQSLLDIIACLSALPVPFKFMAKRELFNIPFIGWHMSLSGYIPINRSSSESGRQAITLAKSWIQKEVSVLFYPEGTRSLDGEIKNFKMGAFRVAVDEGVDILPVVIDGTGDAVPKKSWKLNKISTFRVDVGKPIAVGADQPNDLTVLKNKVHDEMTSRLKRMREDAKS